MPPAPANLRRARGRFSASTIVFLVLAAAAFTAFGVTHNVVDSHERRLLRERAAEVSAVLRNSVDSSNSTLALLALLAALPDQAGFAQGAAALGRGRGGSVVALTQGEVGFTVTASAGGPRAAGQAVSGDLGSLAARALAARVPIADLVREGTQTRLAFAAAGPPPTRVVAVLESDIDPGRPLPRTGGSAFSEMSGALYASPRPDPARLVLTSEQTLPLSGDVVEVPFPVGPDQWTLVVKARSALVGDFPALAPWLLLGAGLLVAVLISAVVRTLGRRQQFADALVQERTHELESTRQFLERLLVSGPAVVVRADLSKSDRRISYVSPNVERILGLLPGDLLERGSLVPYLHPDDVALAEVVRDQLRDESVQSTEIEFRLRRPDGSDLWVSGLTTREIDEHGDSTGVFTYLTDISKRRAAEEGLRSAQQAAEAANRSKSEFLSRMSHELRTPLNAVLGFSQLLKLQPLNDQEAEAVDQIIKGGHHLLDLINEVLDISRIEAGRLLLSPEPVLVSELVQESMDLVRSMAEEREVRLVADRAGMGAYIHADRQRAKQVLLNLLSNAVKYNHPRGSVAVSCRNHSPTELRISVADTGPGIRPELMSRLFAPFDRLDAGQTDVEGTGIGLTLSKSLAEAMGGTLSVDSVPGQGSVFSLNLPRVEGPVERYERLQPEPAKLAVHAPNGHAEPGQRHKVLYIEDNPSNLRLIERILARRGDIDVVSAMQGRFGIELARQHHPSLILLDLHLPDISGEEILRRLLDDPATASIPVVMVTADATVGQVQRLLSAGAVAYLTKPLDVARLLSLVDEMLAPT
jgi:PAS domain S-box-containing protein